MGKGLWNGTSSQVASLNPMNAVYRDTATVLPDAVKPFGATKEQGGCGWTALRFIADNPGVWPFHCHITWHFVMGMQIVFIESQKNLPAPGNDIPICGEVTPEVFIKTNKLVTDSKCESQILLWALVAVGWSLCLCLAIGFVCQCCMSRKSIAPQQIAAIQMRDIKP